MALDDTPVALPASEWARGSEFTVTLPLETAPDV